MANYGFRLKFTLISEGLETREIYYFHVGWFWSVVCGKRQTRGRIRDEEILHNRPEPFGSLTCTFRQGETPIL